MAAFIPERLSTAGKVLVLAAFSIVAVLLWDARRDGPDFGRYYEWGLAALSGNIFELGSDALSPLGVPFSPAAAAPGMLFATTYRAAGELMQFRTAAYVTGWAAAMLFWVCSFAALRSVARGSVTLAAFGTGALFVGTHAGFYSFTYSTEVFASAFVAATWAIALCARSGVLSSAAVGVFAGLLLLVRPYLVLYALAPLWLVVFGKPGEWRRPERRTLLALLAATVPVLLAAIESGIVNRWMTGSPFRPPYVYGGFGFQSVDLLHPQVATVLAHPWRGLLVYHPLYGVAFAALLTAAWRRGPDRLLWAATLAVVLVHLWVQSAWHIWWLGASFGMRGLAPASLPLVLALISVLAPGTKGPARHTIWWLRSSMAACLWSFLLLLQADANNQIMTWPAFLDGRGPAAIALGFLFTVWAIVSVGRAHWNVPDARAELGCSAALLLAASAGYLGSRAQGGTGATVIVIALVVAVSVFSVERISAWSGTWRPRILYGAAVTLFAAQALIFARLAVATERHLASGSPPPRQFRTTGAVPVEDLRQNYTELANIPGFEDRKRKLRSYLNWLDSGASGLPPADRDLAERVLRALSADPVAGTMFVRVRARNGTVYLTSSDSTEATRRRAIEVAASVPGVSGVEAEMK